MTHKQEFTLAIEDKPFTVKYEYNNIGEIGDLYVFNDKFSPTNEVAQWEKVDGVMLEILLELADDHLTNIIEVGLL